MTVPTCFTSQYPKITMGEAVSMGLVAGSQEINKIGFNPSIDGANLEDIWNSGGIYVPLTVAQGLEVLSSSANDTNSAGTGVRSVRIVYLTTDFTQKTTDVLLNGVGAVATTATDIMYINSFRALTAGSGGVAAGNITLRVLSAGATQSTIATGQTRGRKMYYTVPKGKMLMIDVLTYAANGANGKDYLKFTFRANYDENAQAVSTVEFPFFETATTSGGQEYMLTTPLTFPAGVTTRTVVIGNATTAATEAYCGWRGHLMDA